MVILDTNSDDEEVASSFKGQPGLPADLNFEVGEGSHARRNDFSGVGMEHVLRQVLQENQQAIAKLMQGFLSEIKTIFGNHANNIGTSTSTLGGGPLVQDNDPLRTPIAAFIRRRYKRTPNSAPVGRTRRMADVAMEKNTSHAVVKPKYDPNFPPYNHRAVSEFEAWLKEALAGRNDGLLRLACKVERVVDARWLESLWTQFGYLDDQHIDILATMLARDHDSDVGRGARRKWTWLETEVMNVLCQPYFTPVPSRLWAFVTGSRPTAGARPWRTTNRVFGFGRIKWGWFLFEVCFSKQRITVFDPKNLPWGVVEEYFSNMSRHIPSMCKMARVWEAHKFTAPLLDKWEVVPYPAPPMCMNEADTSILALKMMEALYQDLDPYEILATGSHNFRVHLCASLYSQSPDVLRKSSP